MTNADLHAAIRGNPLGTRADAAHLLLDLNAPLRPCFSPGRAQVRLGLDSAHFDRKAEWFEGRWAGLGRPTEDETARRAGDTHVTAPDIAAGGKARTTVPPDGETACAGVADRAARRNRRRLAIRFAPVIRKPWPPEDAPPASPAAIDGD